MLLVTFTNSITYAQHSKKLIVIQQELNENPSDDGILKQLQQIKKSDLNKVDKALYNLLLGKYYLNNNKEDSCYSYYLEAAKAYHNIDSIDREMEINLEISILINAQKRNKSDYIKYFNKYFEYAQKKGDSSKLAKAYGQLGIYENDEQEYEKALNHLKKALSYSKNNEEYQSVTYNNLATIYINGLQQPDSALYYLEKDFKYLKKNNMINELSDNLVNQAAAYHYLGDYKTAISFLKKADSIPITKHVLRRKQYIYDILSINYEYLNDYKEAYEYMLLYQQFADSANVIEQNIAINDIQTKYQTRETELKNEVLTAEVKTGKILVYIFIGLLIASLVIGFLIIKNARRRVYISKQEKLIEQQKLEKALKEFELNSIDLMLEGQEKERERIANDLHDNLGSMLATLKMNFEHLRLRKNEIREEENKLYDRTDQLIEDAYQKVRTIAHAKNAGVFANEGLIPAIRKMAGKISIPGTLTIEVLAVGFNKRLENKIEIAIFRMVQELSTNIIKHSKATEASIQLTNHDDNINIIIEDNGVGFKNTTAPSSDGMGLNTITKKVEQLGGTFTIDSTPGKGTTIIIDLPI